jgi:hypothetical protein
MNRLLMKLGCNDVYDVASTISSSSSLELLHEGKKDFYITCESVVVSI